MIEQDWLMGLLGGLMIGAAAAFYLLANGCILGASGILGELVDGSGRGERAERAAFIAGLVAVPALAVALLRPGAETAITGNLGVILAGGLLVGLGTRLANGCTSGHGVCGISRLAPRGIASTLLYLFAGAVVMYVFRHLLGVI